MSKRTFVKVFLSQQAPYRTLTTTPLFKKWEGSSPKDHITETDDGHNVQIDSARDGAKDRASSDGSSAATEKDPGKSNEKAKVEHPKAPKPIIGMNDERGGVCIYKSGNPKQAANLLSRKIVVNCEKTCDPSMRILLRSNRRCHRQ